MAGSSPQEMSLLLRACRGGNKTALDKLMPLVYDELHRRAHNYMVRERAGATLQTTALVNEAYLRLVDLKGIDWQDRAHFFALAATFMRRILVDFARARGYQKRGGNAIRISIDPALVASPDAGINMIEIDEALTALAEFDLRKAQVVEFRYFAGMTEDETDEVLEVSRETVKRDWRLAKLWLLQRLAKGGNDQSGRVGEDQADL
ncbi:MAG: sigma-70 family RNA polymerase sigma factor [Acidobacteria bacterium]|nr:MAG: sigma-70 family RNA polymerase sigma factor [Acidobacteriota bacterium]